MESPYAGRATITDHFDHIEIIIPAARNVAVMAFLGLWLCGWTTGGLTVIHNLISDSFNLYNSNNTFQLFWLIGWVAGLAFVGRIFIWMLFGKEVIIAGQGLLTISKKFALFVKSRTYDLSDANNFSVLGNNDNGQASTWSRRSMPKVASAGTIRFDYGMKTVKFGEGLGQARQIIL